jgi:membrane-bound lytic murein transglycosylase D
MALGASLAVFQGWETPWLQPPVPGEAPPPPVELPLEVNARVEKWMRRYLTDQKEMFQTFLEREGRFAGMIRAKLRERGMPEDLLYLAMIESGLSPKATSKVEAVGVWQFMSPTAAQYGLRVDEWVDERRDPVKATDAALDYIAFLHERYGSWYLAAAAYNAGPSRVDRALKRHKTARRGDEDVYWEIIDQLPKETREYVPKILAATALGRQAERYGFHVKPAAPYEYDRVWVPGGTGLLRVARALGVESAVLRDLNPHLRQGVTPPGGSYALRVPVGSTSGVIAALGGRPLTQMAD